MSNIIYKKDKSMDNLTEIRLKMRSYMRDNPNSLRYFAKQMGLVNQRTLTDFVYNNRRSSPCTVGKIEKFLRERTLV